MAGQRRRQSTAAGGPPRAPRYAMRVPVRFRPRGAGLWREGMTANVSGSGLLFVATARVAVDEALELRFALPGAGAAQVTGVGRVVRLVPPEDDGGPLGIAVAFESYQLERAAGPV